MKLVRSIDRQFEPASHEDPLDPGVLKKVMVRAGELRDGTLCMVNWSRLEPGKSFVAHYHDSMDEVFIIMEGVAELAVGDTTEVVCGGDTVVIHAGEVHSMKNDSAEAVLFISFGVADGKGGTHIAGG